MGISRYLYKPGTRGGGRRFNEQFSALQYFLWWELGVEAVRPNFHVVKAGGGDETLARTLVAGGQ